MVEKMDEKRFSRQVSANQGIAILLILQWVFCVIPRVPQIHRLRYLYHWVYSVRWEMSSFSLPLRYSLVVTGGTEQYISSPSLMPNTLQWCSIKHTMAQSRRLVTLKVRDVDTLKQQDAPEGTLVISVEEEVAWAIPGTRVILCKPLC